MPAALFTMFPLPKSCRVSKRAASISASATFCAPPNARSAWPTAIRSFDPPRAWSEHRPPPVHSPTQLGQPVSLDSLRGARVAALEGSQQQAFLDGIAGERALTVLRHIDDRRGAGCTAQQWRRLRAAADPYRLCPDQSRQGAALRVRRPGRRQSRPRRRCPHRPAKAEERAAPRGQPGHRGNRADGTFQRIMHRHFPISLD